MQQQMVQRTQQQQQQQQQQGQGNSVSPRLEGHEHALIARQFESIRQQGQQQEQPQWGELQWG
jgi:hypothetical protein